MTDDPSIFLLRISIDKKTEKSPEISVFLAPGRGYRYCVRTVRFFINDCSEASIFCSARGTECKTFDYNIVYIDRGIRTNINDSAVTVGRRICIHK